MSRMPTGEPGVLGEPGAPAAGLPVFARDRPLYRWLAEHVFIVDVVSTVLWAAIAVLPYVFAAASTTSVTWVDVAFSVAITACLPWRRTRPVTAGSIMALLCLVQWLVLPNFLPADLSVLAIVYSLAGYGPKWASRSGLALALIGVVLASVKFFDVFSSNRSQSVQQIVVQLTILFVAGWAVVGVAWLLGDMTATRRRERTALREHALRLEQQQAQERALSAADERARIAREMHDVVAHSLSVIIRQADGASYALASDPAVAPRVLKTIADTGRQSLAEMRRLLGVLRSDGADDARPQPSLQEIPELIERVQTFGPVIDATIDERPGNASLPTGAELVIYRVVQEALTNVLKHAGDHVHVTVSLRWKRDAVTVEVADDGLGAAAALVSDGNGNGIQGMRERVALYDGTFAARPRAGGGFSVVATLPYGE